ncbi:MAG: 4-hydroxybenzoate octaprenyltransferase [Gammaproteobacteria bacterium]|jgi:4-hydroxybenzoate polyprenyltransferase|nr:4-hydroxybenzoate octaprenyltransferase [Gammaproteobacteria bacterium]
MFKNKFSLYIKLMRLDSPIGILLLIWPPFWVIVSLNNGNIYDLIALIFLIGVVTTRTIGCVINDFFDKNFDKNVSRTSNRPYAANLVNKKEVFLIFFILAAINLTLLFFLNLKTIYIGCVAIIFIILYPLTKRFFVAPQIFLGITFGISALMSHSAVTNTYPDHIAWLFFFATLIWVTMFDTIYAMSDKSDDLKIGINSTAILFGDNDKIIIFILQCIFFITFFYIGLLKEYGYIFYFFLILAIVIGVYNQIIIKSRKSKLCLIAFKNNQYIGFLIFLGIYGEYIL